MTLADRAPTYNLCRFCLMCRHVCPVGRTTKREANTPHGWALLIASVDRGQMQWDADSIDTLYECADCGLCQSFCVTDQPLPSAIVAARAHVASLGAAPKSVAELNAKLQQWGNPYKEVAPAASNGKAGTALFVGAAAQHLRPQTLEAARRLLDALAIQHTLIGVGRSSAYLPYSLGLRETAQTLAQATLAEIAAAGCEQVVVLTAEDVHTFKNVWRELGLALPAGVEIVELISLLDQYAEKFNLRSNDAALTYHDPAHTPRLPGRAAIARKLLSALTTQPLHEMFWREQRAAPGGAAGGLEFTHPDLAEKMTRERLAEAASTGAHLLVTEDPLALAHMSALVDGAGIKVEGLYELWVQQMA